MLSVAGFAMILYFVWGWFKDVIHENSLGINNFFGTLFYARQFALPWLSGDGNNFFTNELLHKGFEGGWPSNGPENMGGDFQSMGPFWLPTINTILLISSSFTVTIAHHAMLKNNMKKAFNFTMISVVLGAIFMYCQIMEYSHAYSDLNLTLETGMYGSTFYMLTGLHGFHVTHKFMDKRLSFE